MKSIRLGKIFRSDQKTVIVACDHAGFMGPVKGLEKPGELLDILRATGVDAILTTYGIASRFPDRLGKLGLILRMDGGSSIKAAQSGEISQIFSIEDACRLGADAVICMGMIGYPEEPSSLANIASLTAEAAFWNMPVIAEMLVKPSASGVVSAEEVGFAMRIGVELGADLIKASYARPDAEYSKALSTCYRPVVVLGGEKTHTDCDLLEGIAEALSAGASGVAIGRNVWQHKDPAGICRALVALVHDGAKVEQALKEIKG
jgi:DhnA family fructose-bisphosphate aldolase class Ia